jgi:hypothetical protein
VVKDIEGNPIFNATVHVKGTQNFTTTDFYGNYSLVASSEDVLVFSYTGYESVEFLVSIHEVINVFLEVATDLVDVSINHPYSINNVSLVYGVNYNTFGLEISNYKGLLPAKLNFDLQYASDFNRNASYHYSLNRYVAFSDNFNLNFLVSASSADFEGFQYHNYKLETSKSFDILQFNTKYYSFPRINLILGYINYDGLQDENRLGYGMGLSRELLKT